MLFTRGGTSNRPKRTMTWVLGVDASFESSGFEVPSFSRTLSGFKAFLGRGGPDRQRSARTSSKDLFTEGIIIFLRRPYNHPCGLGYKMEFLPPGRLAVSFQVPVVLRVALVRCFGLYFKCRMVISANPRCYWLDFLPRPLFLSRELVIII